MFKPDDTITLDGDSYRILSKLGSGGQAQAWKVARQSDGAVFALRVVNPYEVRAGRKTRRSLQVVSNLNRRMRDEITFLQALPDAQAHYILPCLGAGTVEHQGNSLVAMLAPLMPDELSNYCPSLTCDPKPFIPEQLLRWGQQLAIALAHIHQKDSNDTPHVHRDLKPSNILLDSAGNAFLSDFGILKAARHIGTNSIAFSAECCAPEQRLPLYLLEEKDEDGRDRHKRQYFITTKADIYALGMVFHNLLLGSTKAQDDLAENSTVDTHIKKIPVLITPPDTPQPVEDLGKLGGLLVVEQKALLKKLTTWLRPTLSSTGTFIPTDTADTTPSLPDYPWLAENMTQFIIQMLKPWPEHRPSAEAVQQKVKFWQAALFPTLGNLVLKGQSTYSTGITPQFMVEYSLNYYFDCYNWFQIFLDEKIQRPDWEKNFIDVDYEHTMVTFCLPAMTTQGKHTVRLEALVGGVRHEAKHTFEVVMSAQQLWDAGKHEQALQRELRPAWLEQQLAGLTSVSTAYAFMQMLERLKTAHPTQTGTLETFRQRADQFAAKPPEPLKLFEKLLSVLSIVKQIPPIRLAILKSAIKRTKLHSVLGIVKQIPPIRLAILKSVIKRTMMAVMWLLFLGGTGLLVWAGWMAISHKFVSVSDNIESVEAALLPKLHSSEATERAEAYAQLEVLAKDASNSNAQQWMGYRYLIGDGVEKDLQLAKEWYTKAKDGGSRSAATQLEEIDKALKAGVGDGAPAVSVMLK